MTSWGKLATQIAKNCRRRQPHSHLMPRQEVPPRISPQILYFQKLGSLAYIFVTDSMGLSSFNLCSGLQKDAYFLRQSAFGRSRSFKVDDFGTNRKHVCDFLLVPHCDYGPILHRFWDMATYLAKNCLIFLPLSHSMPSLPVFPLEFCGEINHEETRVMGLLSGESCMILTSSIFDWSTRVTDRQRDGRAIAYSALYRCLSGCAVLFELVQIMRKHGQH